MEIKRFPKNESGRDFVVGDVHGCYDALTSKLDRIGFDKAKDRLFSVGDLIDRGPNSLKCLELAYEDWFFPVLGNHEKLMFDALINNCGASLDCWLCNGGAWVYSEDMGSFKALIKDIQSKFPLAIEVEGDGKVFGVVHADCPELWHEEEFYDNQEAAVWGRSRLPKNKTIYIEGIDHVYAGHTPHESAPITLGNITYIDSGAVFTGKLTILELT